MLSSDAQRGPDRPPNCKDLEVVEEAPQAWLLLFAGFGVRAGDEEREAGSHVWGSGSQWCPVVTR